MSTSLTQPRPDPVARTRESLEIFSKLPVNLRPHNNLLTYYVLSSFLLGPAFLFILVPMYFRYLTLRYEIDSEGIRMKWGILFRREVSLTYARIQDIHLNSNFVQRWLGLGKIQVQTASGSATAEMTIEGIKEYELLRDFLYERMRGARDSRGRSAKALETGLDSGAIADLTAALDATAAEMRAIRELLQRQRGGEG